MNVRLFPSDPVAVASTFSRYRRWGQDPVNRLEDGRFRRAIEVDGRWHGYDLTWTEDVSGTRITIRVPGRHRPRFVDAAVAGARHILGLDLERFYERGRALSEPAIRRRASRWG